MAVAQKQATQWAGSLEPSPAGPIDESEAATLARAPASGLPRALQVLRFSQRQIEWVFACRRRLGPVFRLKGVIPGDPTVTSHPDHVKSLFTAKPGLAPSLTGESPLRPILGSNSVLTSVGDRHMRQRKLLLPPFHGEAVDRYVQMIDDVTEREIDRWPQNEPIALAPRMQAITLDVIMRGIFGVEGEPAADSPEARLRDATRRLTEMSTMKVAQLGELANLGRSEPVGLTKLAMRMIDRPTFAVIAARRRATDLDDRTDIMSLLMRARTEDGEALSDQELRDELLTLVLAGHETTANQLAWTWERLVRWPEALERLTEAVRGDQGADEAIEQTIHESMRSRPVVPIIGRRVTVPWRLGEYSVPAGAPISMSILLVHHREDIYPDPFSFRPERWEGVKPDTYRWIPFGGGVRRCLGATLAMAEQRVVLKAMARRLDLQAVEPEPEHALHRNVTMIPAKGGLVRASRR